MVKDLGYLATYLEETVSRPGIEIELKQWKCELFFDVYSLKTYKKSIVPETIAKAKVLIKIKYLLLYALLQTLLLRCCPAACGATERACRCVAAPAACDATRSRSTLRQ